MGINYFGAFYLTHLLADKLLQQPRSRVVFENSVSEVHGELHWDDLTYVPRSKSASCARAISSAQPQAQHLAAIMPSFLGFDMAPIVSQGVYILGHPVPWHIICMCFAML